MRVDQSGQILDKSPWHDHRASHCLTRAGLICPGLSAELLLLYLQPDHTTAWPRLLLLWQRLFHTAAGPRSWHWAFCPPISLITLITTTLICGCSCDACVVFACSWPVVSAASACCIVGGDNLQHEKCAMDQRHEGPGGQMQSRNLNYVFSKPSWVRIKIEYWIFHFFAQWSLHRHTLSYPLPCPMLLAWSSGLPCWSHYSHFSCSSE